jgi:hypothetical protein
MMAMHKKEKEKKHKKKHHEKEHEKHEHMKKKDPKDKKSETKYKMKKVMKEFGSGELHSGSKKGPVVTNPKQAVAIAYSEAKKAKRKKK